MLIRAGWRNARWLDAEGAPVDLLAEFRKASDCGLIDRPIFIGRKNGKPLALRLVAVKNARASAKKTHVPMHGRDMLAPMRSR